METAVDTLKSQKGFVEYASKELGVKFKLFTAAEYAGIVNGLAAGQVHVGLARRQQLRIHLYGLPVRGAHRRGAESPGRHGLQLGPHRQVRKSLQEIRGPEGQDGGRATTPIPRRGT